MMGIPPTLSLAPLRLGGLLLSSEDRHLARTTRTLDPSPPIRRFRLHRPVGVLPRERLERHVLDVGADVIREALDVVLYGSLLLDVIGVEAC
jgi:hypothetical protein